MQAIKVNFARAICRCALPIHGFDCCSCCWNWSYMELIAMSYFYSTIDVTPIQYQQHLSPHCKLPKMLYMIAYVAQTWIWLPPISRLVVNAADIYWSPDKLISCRNNYVLCWRIYVYLYKTDWTLGWQHESCFFTSKKFLFGILPLKGQ